MKHNVILLIIAIASAILFAKGVSLEQIYIISQPILVCLSIMSAAVLVRLNRGIPQVEWRELKYDEKKKLSNNFVEITKEYCLIISLFFILFSTIIIFMAVGIEYTKSLPLHFSQILSGIIGLILGACLFKMGYVIWRDYDIVVLQREIIMRISDNQETEYNNSIANENIKKIKEANLRHVPNNPPDNLLK